MRRSILIIDDEPVIREFLSDYLKEEGFRVSSAENGKRGLEALSRHPVDLVVTDIVMPEKEGIETLVEIKKRHPGMPVIAMTGASNRGTYLALARSLGADRCMDKPVSGAEITSAIKTLFNRLN